MPCGMSVFFGRCEHHIPAITTVATSVSDDITDEPAPVLWGRSQQMRRTAAVDADDLLRRRLCHCVAACITHVVG